MFVSLFVVDCAVWVTGIGVVEDVCEVAVVSVVVGECVNGVGVFVEFGIVCVVVEGACVGEGVDVSGSVVV